MTIKLRIFSDPGEDRLEQDPARSFHRLLGELTHKTLEFYFKHLVHKQGELSEKMSFGAKGALSTLTPSFQYDIAEMVFSAGIVEEEKLKEGIFPLLKEEIDKIIKPLLLHPIIGDILFKIDKDTAILSEVELFNGKGAAYRIDLLKINPLAKEIKVIEFKTFKSLEKEKDAEKQLRNYRSILWSILKSLGSPQYTLRALLIYVCPPEIKEVMP